MNSLVAHHLLVFTLCSRQVSPSHPEKAAHHQHEKKELRKGQNGKHPVDHQQNGNLTGATSADNIGHTIHENSLEAKNGTAVEYEVGLVKNDNGGLAYHLTFTKKAPRAKLAETDIPEESDQDDGAAGEGDQVEGDQVDEGVDRYGNGGRFKPQIISYEAVGKENEEGGEQQDHKLKKNREHQLHFLPTTDALKGRKRSDHRKI